MIYNTFIILQNFYNNFSDIIVSVTAMLIPHVKKN